MPARKARRAKPIFTPSQRRDALRILLRTGWQPLRAVMDRLGVSRATAFRRLKELGETDPLEFKEEGRLSYWRLPSATRDPSIELRISTAEMVALAFVQNALGFLAGTGIKEDLDALVARVVQALKSSDHAHWKNLDRKLHDMNEGVHDYSSRSKIDVLDDVSTALLREERVDCTLKDGRTLLVDPYTLVLYKKGLYLLGFSHHHKELRSFAIDKIEETARRAGERFDYPRDFDPKAHFKGPFGMIRGPREDVLLHFDAVVRYFVERRNWHPSQQFGDIPGGLAMTLSPDGTTEMVSWILSFGAKAEVLAPPGLRAEVLKEARALVARYERSTPPEPTSPIG